MDVSFRKKAFRVTSVILIGVPLIALALYLCGLTTVATVVFVLFILVAIVLPTIAEVNHVWLTRCAEKKSMTVREFIEAKKAELQMKKEYYEKEIEKNEKQNQKN